MNPDFLGKLLNELEQDPDCGVEKAEHPLSIVVDYGGPNVAKPLHVGHLRPAIIGEAVKRIARFMGHNVIGDPHLGDWGLQIGLIIVELKRRQPDLPYFDAEHHRRLPGGATLHHHRPGRDLSLRLQGLQGGRRL